jgi:hypothetical protein
VVPELGAAFVYCAPIDTRIHNCYTWLVLSTNTTFVLIGQPADTANRLRGDNPLRIKVVLLVRCPLVSLGRYMPARWLSRLVLSQQTLSHTDGYAAGCPVAALLVACNQ